MVLRPKNLPEFKKPPVIEVLLSIQFAELVNFKTVHAGLLWKEIFRKKYPQVEEHPRLESSFEVFGKKSAQNKNLGFSVKTTPEVSRLWFVKGDDIELVQFQPDRFVHNWRKRKEKNVYPRYEAIKKEFLSELKNIKRFLKDEKLGKIQPNQCEITYVNHIEPPGDPDKLWKNLNEIFQFCKRFNNSKEWAEKIYLGLNEGENINFRQPVFNENKDFLGRLYISIEPASALTAENEEIIRFVLSVKGPPQKSSIKAVLEFYDMGREIIVNNFTFMTTDKMHKIWKRRK